MVRRTIALALSSLILACQAPAPAPTPPADATADLAAQNERFMAAVAAKDAAGLATLYTENGSVLAPNAAEVRGRAAVQGFWQAVMDMGIAGATLTTVEVSNTDTDAIEVGTFVLRTADGTEADNGKYIVWWKKSDAGWQLHRDIFNSDRPVAPPAK